MSAIQLTSTQVEEVVSGAVKVAAKVNEVFESCSAMMKASEFPEDMNTSIKGHFKSMEASSNERTLALQTLTVALPVLHDKLNKISKADFAVSNRSVDATSINKSVAHLV